MAVDVPEPQAMQRYVDSEGRLTTEGMILFLKMLAVLEDHETRLVAGGL